MKLSQTHSRLATNIFVTFLLACICTLTGCLSRPALNKQTFAFSAPANAYTNVVASDRVLGIRNLQIATPFEGRSFVYRTGEFSYVRDPYAEFLESPAEELMVSVRGLLRGNGNFNAVVESGSAFKPDTLVEISVSQLFGDFRQTEHPSAILTMRFVFFDAPNGVPGKIILEQEYSRSIPLSSPTSAALMEGWNQALVEILTKVSSDFARMRELRWRAKERPAPRSKNLSCLGQPDGFCGAFKKLESDLDLEVVNLAADARLRDMELQRGARNIFFLGDGDEVAEMTQFHFREHSQKLLSGKKHGIS